MITKIRNRYHNPPNIVSELATRNGGKQMRPDSLVTTALSKLFTYLLTHLDTELRQ